MDYPAESTPPLMLREMQGFKPIFQQCVFFIRALLDLLKSPPRAGTRSFSFPVVVRPFALSLTVAHLTAQWLTFSRREKSIFTQGAPQCLGYSSG